ncbi:MAG TPA: putative sulfate exporter family transporter [Bacteroidia bacterium]|jgi:uncharacterized integral membrane protein (TIGR00698 family)|nr:putative sulfate exporter family transporter [Bacteroidia bacterium]
MPDNSIHIPEQATEMEISQTAQLKKGPNISEDWLAVFIGGFIIAAFLVLSNTGVISSLKLPNYKWDTLTDLTDKVFSVSNLLHILKIGFIFLILATLGSWAQGGDTKKFVAGFSIVYLLGIISLILAGNKTLNYYGFEYVIFALAIGLLLGNLTTVPDWVKEAARSEFFIKTGLVILGTSILFSDVVKAGAPGILQAIIVVLVVWFFSIRLSRALKIDDEFGVMLASAVSICGVSAAIVACGVIEGDKKKLSYVTTLVVIMALPMLLIQPWIIRYFNIPEIVGGAWLGGTLDTTASVTAAGQLVGPIATKAGVIVKFSQNVLIGVVAFILSIWWSFRNKTRQVSDSNVSKSVRLGVIWERFPKFVLGFIAASILFSFIVSPTTVAQIGGLLNGFRTIWFSLAFVAIGLEARFADLIKLDGGKPALVFTTAQLFNILWTLLWAFLLFGGILFTIPDIK